MVRVRISKHLAVIKSFSRGKKNNMGHLLNDPNCSIANLVWAPVDIITDTGTKREAEKATKARNTLDEKNVLHATVGHELYRN